LQTPAIKFLGVLLLAWILLMAVSLVFPGDGKTGPLGLKFYSFTELWKPNYRTPVYALKTDSLINYYRTKNEALKHSSGDSLLPFPEIDLNRQGFLTRPEALLSFFDALKYLPDSGNIRVAHYGDSQIEGDRITAHIRKLLQSHFGGKAIGFIPLSDPANVYAYDREGSGNWKRYTVFQQKHPNKIYGISGVSFRFEEVEIRDSISPDNIINRTLPGNQGKLTFNFKHALKFDSALIAYAPIQSPCLMKVFLGDTLISKTILKGNAIWNETLLPISPDIGTFTLEFRGEQSPDFYGIYLKDQKGIGVDNYAIRGHSGEGLNLISEDILNQTGEDQNIKLLILQFGNNAIPYLDSLEECRYFEHVYYQIFSRLKRILPQTSILVMGVGDMLTRQQGVEITWPLLIPFRDAQKRAAERADCAFWDVFEAMGGERSLLAWNEKKLASTDGHFSPAGQQLIGVKLHEDLMTAFQLYHKQK